MGDFDTRYQSSIPASSRPFFISRDAIGGKVDEQLPHRLMHGGGNVPRETHQEHGTVGPEPSTRQITQTIGQTTVVIHMPEPCSDVEHKARRDAVIRAIAQCLSKD